jgi:hypothetical protein
VQLTELVKELNLEVRSARDNLDREITGGYASDLLSDVIAHGQEGNLWVTLQVHQNIVAVASMKDLAAVVLVNSREPEAETVEKAEQEGLPILVSSMSTFELVGRLYDLGVARAR